MACAESLGNQNEGNNCPYAGGINRLRNRVREKTCLTAGEGVCKKGEEKPSGNLRGKSRRGRGAYDGRFLREH